MVRAAIVTVAIVLTFSTSIVGCGFEALPEGQYTLTISSSRCGYVDRPGEGVFVYDEGTVVELVANPVGDNPFVKWTGDVSTVADVEDAATSITMNDDYAVTATFQCGHAMCFIATAAYGTSMTEEILILRELRDQYLLTNCLGQKLIDIYYTVSPPIAELITHHPSLKAIVRTGLLPAVALSSVIVNTTATEKAVMIGLLGLVSMTLAIWVIRRQRKDSECT